MKISKFSPLYNIFTSFQLFVSFFQHFFVKFSIFFHETNFPFFLQNLVNPWGSADVKFNPASKFFKYNSVWSSWQFSVDSNYFALYKKQIIPVIVWLVRFFIQNSSAPPSGKDIFNELKVSKSRPAILCFSSFESV